MRRLSLVLALLLALLFVAARLFAQGQPQPEALERLEVPGFCEVARETPVRLYLRGGQVVEGRLLGVGPLVTLGTKGGGVVYVRSVAIDALERREAP